MSEKLTAEFLTSQEDWRDLYLERGQEMLDLAVTLLESSDKEEINLGLRIVEGAYFEEDEENPDAKPSLAHLNFGDLVEPLESLADDKKYAKRVKHCLRIIKLEKGEKDPVDLSATLEGLEAKSESKVRKAVDGLVELAKQGVDISGAFSYIASHEEKLAMATDVMQALAIYYVKQSKYDELLEKLKGDDAASIRMYRGITGAMMNGFDMKEFLDHAGVMDRLHQISDMGKVPSIDGVIAGEY